MHGAEFTNDGATAPPSHGPWYRELNKYHWFVLIVAALGWLFDTMDQQLFNLARVPAMNTLLVGPNGESANPRDVEYYAGLSTCIFLMGWATGGLAFGILGDRVGRAKTMLWTILIYSAFTGLSALSVGFWDFAIYRFLTGLGVGGEFAVGVALVAEVMPVRARPFALGLLQALSAVGNISAALISIALSSLEESGAIGSAWRAMFVVGTLPALLAILIRRRLKEPERWQSLSDAEMREKLGSYRELFGHPTWRRHAIFGMLLAFSGVVGLWGIGFFVIDLSRSIFLKKYQETARLEKEAEHDRDFLRMAVQAPHLLAPYQGTDAKPKLLAPAALLGLTPGNSDPERLLVTLLAIQADKKRIQPDELLDALENNDKEMAAKLGQSPPSAEKMATDRARRQEYLMGNSDTSRSEPTEEAIAAHVTRISARHKSINGSVSFWVGMTSIMINLGAFFGIYGFTYLTHYIGRRPAFFLAFVSAMASTMYVFAYLSHFSEVFWMIPIMGFCQLSLFGGYAIYFPELFPTHLRSTGTSFCYNVGRFVAASGPFALGMLTKHVYASQTEPLRYAGITMCAVFLLGLIVIPFLPETKGKPLPE